LGKEFPKGKISQTLGSCQDWLCFKYIFLFRIHNFPAEYQDFAVLPVSRVRCHSYILTGNESVKTMLLGSMRLRLESGDGSPAKEYRIEEGNVEVRTLDPDGESVRRPGSVWWQLTPEQLSVHVERNTVVAQWLERRLGWRRLLQACVGQEPTMWKAAENTNHPAL
jgi:hypothetical protein